MITVVSPLSELIGPSSLDNGKVQITEVHTFIYTAKLKYSNRTVTFTIWITAGNDIEYNTTMKGTGYVWLKNE